MIDIVYPLKANGSKLDDAELRFSLRSIAKNLQLEVRDLWIVGFMPKWAVDAKHIPMRDTLDKAMNLREKYRAMCSNVDISDPFLLLDDDHMFLQPTTEIPLYSKGVLLKLCQEYSGSVHGQYLRAALDRLRAERMQTINYQIHYPMIIQKPVLRGAIAMMARPMVMGSIYGNLLDGPRIEVTQDFRVNSVEDFESRKNGSFISLPPSAKPGWLDFLREQFPEPSRWELSQEAKVAA